MHKSGRISSAQTVCNQKEVIAEASFSPSCFTEQLFPWQHRHSSGSDMANLDEQKQNNQNSHKPYPSIHFSLVWAMQGNMRLNYQATYLRALLWFWHRLELEPDLKRDYKSPAAAQPTWLLKGSDLNRGGAGNEGVVSVLSKNKSSLTPQWRKRAWL